MSRILITVPTWNESVVIERNLLTLSEAIQRLLPEHHVTIEVADNASTDDTRTIVHRVKTGLSNVLLLELNEQGKGLAIRRSWERHFDDADVLVFMDADLAADLEALPRLVAPIIEGHTDLVCGSRFLPGAQIKRDVLREVASRTYHALQKILLDLPVKDAQCGFKAMSVTAAKEILSHCEERGWMFDTELIAFTHKKNYLVYEIPVDWIESRNPDRRSALRLFHHGWGFLSGLLRVKRRLRNVAQ
ncbi:MAG: glycosyltransferase [Patescibacteria group bacterium]|jgi:glycosyltransferase involved in cell wall biosynthesis